MLRQVCAPALVAVEQYLGIGIGAEFAAVCLEGFAEFAMIVDLAIEGDNVATVCGRHGLGTGFEPDNGQASMA